MKDKIIEIITHARNEGLDLYINAVIAEVSNRIEEQLLTPSDYRMVDASERLPKMSDDPDQISDEVFVIGSEESYMSVAYYDYKLNQWSRLYHSVQYWLEPTPTNPTTEDNKVVQPKTEQSGEIREDNFVGYRTPEPETDLSKILKTEQSDEGYICNQNIEPSECAARRDYMDTCTVCNSWVKNINPNPQEFLKENGISPERNKISGKFVYSFIEAEKLHNLFSRFVQPKAEQSAKLLVDIIEHIPAAIGTYIGYKAGSQINKK